MADKLRSINTHFWDDSYIVQLDPIEKLLFLYLLSNPLTNIAGAYEITLRRVAFDTGIDAAMCQKMLDRFGADEKVKYIDGWIILKNFIKNQHLSDKAIIGANKIIEALPPQIKIAYDSLSKPMLKVQKRAKQSEYESEFKRERESEAQGARDSLPALQPEKPEDPGSGIINAVAVLWNETFTEAPCKIITAEMTEGIKQCLSISPDYADLKKWRALFKLCRKSDFLQNKLSSFFGLAWVLQVANFKKLLETDCYPNIQKTAGAANAPGKERAECQWQLIEHNIRKYGIKKNELEDPKTLKFIKDKGGWSTWISGLTDRDIPFAKQEFIKAYLRPAETEKSEAA